MVFFPSCNFLKIIFYSFFLFFIQGKENLKFSTKKKQFATSLFPDLDI